MDNPAATATLEAMEQDILITGGGLTGAAMALAAAQAGARVTLLDRTPEGTQAEGFDGRSYALALASRRMLEALGVWEGIAEAQPILEVLASDGRPGEGPGGDVLHLDHAELEEGPMGHMVEDRHLRPALQAALAVSPAITLRSGAEVVAQSQAGSVITVTLASGETFSAPLLIGADGKTSGTAARAGISRQVTDYGQVALVCAVAHSAPHHGVAHQFFMPGGPLAILPLQGNRSSIVWSEEASRARDYAALDDAAFLEVLRPRFGSFLGEISLAGARWSYPLVRSIAAHAVGPRFALVGDAAQAIHPIAGQGLNQGLRDVATLADVLAEARRRGEDLGATPVLERYRQWRSFDRTAIALATDGFNRLFSNDNPLLRLGRGAGLSLVTRVPALRRAFLREAAGLTGDLPRLLQGRPV